MKYKGLNECWTCERYKRGECKKPVSLDKRDHGGCSDWENDELYEAWRADFGAEIEAVLKAGREYEARKN